MKTPLLFIEIYSILALRMRIKMRKLIPVSLLLLIFCCAFESNSQCIAEYGFDDSSLVVPFENQSQNIVGDPIISLYWDFGDGTNSDNESPQHIYADAGAYLTSLAIETESGCRDTISKSIYICNFDLDYDLQVGCDEDNRVSLDLFIDDTYGNAGPFTITIDGIPLTENPLEASNGVINLQTELLADGLDHIVSINSLEHPNCSIQEIITVTACVPPCNLSNLKVQLIDTDTIIAEVNSLGYSPDALSITTGNNVLFRWINDDRSVTSLPNTNGQDWDSGILNTGDEFLLYSFAPGIFSYSSSNSPQGFNEGTLVSTCPDTASYNLMLTFENGGQTGSYALWIDGVPTSLNEIPYNPSGGDSLNLVMPGDGVLHRYSIIDNTSSSCNLTSEIQAPNCAAQSVCNLYVEAVQSTPCNQDSLVEIEFTILSAGGSENGFNLFIDEELFESGIPYDGTETIITKSLFGDGEEHLITIQDVDADTCNASTLILLEDCSQPCLIINPFAGVGSNNNIVVNVLDDTFSPKDITISAGDKIIWQWQTDTLRSVTAFDFSFDSGVQGFGASFTSPILPIGVHRYYSEFNGMEGSITVEPNCNNSLIPIVYSFNKFGGANTGYDVFIDEIKINGSPISYQPNGINIGNSFVEGDGALHSVSIVDAVDSTCATIQSFEVPFCDESTCAIFLEDPVIGDCESNNTVVINANVLSYNTNDSLLLILVDGVIRDTMKLDTSGVTSLDVWLAGDGLTHTLVLRDLLESSCSDTLSFDTPLCSAPCSFSSIELEYLEESPMDTCFDGSTQFILSSQAVQNFDSEYIVSLTSSFGIEEKDTFPYPLDGSISQLFNLPADGSVIEINFSNSMDNGCFVDTSFTLYQCDPDPCQLSLIDLTYGSCMNGGVMDVTIGLDTFRISDSLYIEFDDTEVFRGSYEEFYSNPTFPITYTGEERTIRVFDINNSSCRLSENFFTPVCSIDCIISANYSLLDTCILAQDTSYTIILSADVLNADSDSVEVEIVSSGTSFIFAYSDLLNGIPIEISITDENPTVGIFDSQNNLCRDFISIDPPTCILDCSIEISSIAIIDSTCINGETLVEIKLDFDLPASDSIQLIIDNEFIFETPYPMDSIITTPIIGDGMLHNFIVTDIQNEECSDTLSSVIEECEFSCDEFIADFSFSIDTISQTINFMDQTLGGSNVWNWDLGDGTVSSDANPFHTYSTIGSYVVCLIVENNEENCIQEVCKEIELVDINCNASFNLETNGLMVSFTNTSTSNSPIDSLTWQINGETELVDIQSGSFTAESSSSFEICLTIHTDSECSDIHCETINLVKPCTLNPSFEFDIELDTIRLDNTSTGDYTSTSWSLGDGTITNGESIAYIYDQEGDYTICMTVIDEDSEDCEFTICEDITIVTCNLNAVFLVNINQDILNVELVDDLGNNEVAWDFGNGFSASINPVEYVYPDEGEYTVCATVIDTSQENCSELHCEEISIILSDINSILFEEIRLYPNPISKGDIITIDNPQQSDLRIEIYSVLGQIIMPYTSKEKHSYQIQTIEMHSGRYLVRISSGTRTITKSIVITD